VRDKEYLWGRTNDGGPHAPSRLEGKTAQKQGRESMLLTLIGNKGSSMAVPRLSGKGGSKKSGEEKGPVARLEKGGGGRGVLQTARLTTNLDRKRHPCPRPRKVQRRGILKSGLTWEEEGARTITNLGEGKRYLGGGKCFNLS